MLNKIVHYTGLLACIGIIIACFMPWTNYHNINETFNGFNVKPFAAGNYYGKAGRVITVLAVLVLLLMLVRRVWAKRVNLFLAAILVAYSIRTYIIFTSALFPGEVKKYPGIYLIVILSVVILISTVFPRLDLQSKELPGNKQ
jgi:uncharacterized membrane protein